MDEDFTDEEGEFRAESFSILESSRTSDNVRKAQSDNNLSLSFLEWYDEPTNNEILYTTNQNLAMNKNFQKVKGNNSSNLRA